MKSNSPKNLGYRMPAEWEPHESTWLIWPHNDTHEDSQLHLEHLWLVMTIALHKHETVHIIVPDERCKDHLHNSSTIQTLSKLAKDLQIVLIASLFEKHALGIYHNTSVVIDADGSFLGRYRKMHIPDDPHYYEKFYFTPGDLGYKVFKTKYADIGVLICWDQWYPEAARILGLKGAEIIFIPTAIGYSKTSESTTYDQSWQTVQRGHAVANACFLAAVNRVGFEADPSIALPASYGNEPGVGPNGESGINFWGQSFVTDPDGSVLNLASKDQEEIVICPVDLSIIEETKQMFSFPYRDRRVDSYQDLLKLYSE